MAITDIAGFLTGQSSKRPDPMGRGINSEQQRLAFGAQRAEGLQRGVRGMMGGDTMTPAEQLQIAMASLDLSKPEDLRKLAGIQQATGDLAGAAQTASKITAMQQAKVEETRAVAREGRSKTSAEQNTESFELSKVDRAKRIKREEVVEKRAIEASKRAETSSTIQQEQNARAKAASEKAISNAERLKLQEADLRAMYKKHAISKGKPELAEQIEAGMSLKKAEELLYKTSTATIPPLTGKEEDVYHTLIDSPAMQAAIPKLLTDATSWYHVGKLSDSQEDAIFLKTKEISVRDQIRIDDAMLKAMKELSALETAPPTAAEIEQAAKVAAQVAATAGANGTPTATPVVPSSTDAFANIPKTGSGL